MPETQPVSSANFHHFMTICTSYSGEKIPGSPSFTILKVTESWAGFGNEANLEVCVTLVTFPRQNSICPQDVAVLQHVGMVTTVLHSTGYCVMLALPLVRK